MANVSELKILVLDDEPFMLKLMVGMLKNEGIVSITTQESARVALQWLDAPENSPDVIVLDLNMPDMDGVEFLRRLVERRYTGGLILMSGEDQRVLQTAENLVNLHKLALLGRLDKPVSPKKLHSLLDSWSATVQRSSETLKKIYTAEELRAAIVNNELVHYYQPKVAVASGDVVGVESLVRWRHPRDGMIFPDQFIGVAEANGLIDDLTRAVLIAAFAHTQAWHKMGLQLRVAVNVSMDNLSSLDFPDFVANIAAEAGVPPQDVVLEVTESRLMQDRRNALDILTRLRLKRFRLSIDDFGTGHSSLSQLRDIPFDELKIDRGFVHGAWKNATVRAIYYASLALARQLGMAIVAEGVEDLDDMNFLRSSGCEFAQGYFIAKPMPADELKGWITDWQQRVRSEFAVKG